jgi:hypothetical protein
MNPKRHYQTILISALAVVIYMLNSGTAWLSKEQPDETDTLRTNTDLEGYPVALKFTKGRSHNYPLMALWLEDTAGNYIRTLYVAESIAKGFFDYGEVSKGKWKPGPIRRPAALPYWAHKRNIKAEDGLYIPSQKKPMPDAVTGATPVNDFIIYTNTGKIGRDQFNILFEINQTWDWNEYWTNNKYPENDEYITSCQPALVYKTTIDMKSGQTVYPMKAVGHSHYAGETGELFKDLSTLTTALEIADTVIINILE